uniref:Dbuz\CG14609d-PA n=1 Tax=Drosophila buzzatii TaxID=7264 RepID=Q4VIV7_DROBU|nr:Dbuz\CG14609d-PA [Drosophila buzzatii]
MPCYSRNRIPSKRQLRDKRRTIVKPVRPRDPNVHGLLSYSHAAQHLIFDENWTPSSITEQYTFINSLLTSRLIFNKHEKETLVNRLHQTSERLKEECFDGRLKLQKISVGNNAHEIRNMLNNHMSMQRLYQRMPIHLVADNINQSTFVMRKERDRLHARLEQLKHKLNDLLIERSLVENRIKYESSFVLEEELLSRVLLKKIENSNVRFRAIRTINTTYKKMVQVLLQDEIFYEPILSSLDDDNAEQTHMIKYIIYLGLPAISKFKQLNKEFHRLEEKARVDFEAKRKLLADLKKPRVFAPPVQPDLREVDDSKKERYLRETKSMVELRKELQKIEKVIKDLKFTTLCSQAKEIYLRARTQRDNNKHLAQQIEFDLMGREMLRNKIKYTNVLDGVLVNNLSEEEVNRLEYIRSLKATLNTDKDFQQESVNHIRNRASVYVMLRFSLWNLVEILRHIDHNPFTVRRAYPNSYLKLPLLKFELFDMFACNPPLYEENIDKIMHLVKRKLYKLVKGFETIAQADSREPLASFKEKYHKRFLATRTFNVEAPGAQSEMKAVDYDDGKVYLSVPSRKQIKTLSAKVVEEARLQEEY